MRYRPPHRERWPAPAPTGWLVLALGVALFGAGSSIGSGWIVLFASVLVTGVLGDVALVWRSWWGLDVSGLAVPGDGPESATLGVDVALPRGLAAVGVQAPAGRSRAVVTPHLGSSTTHHVTLAAMRSHGPTGTFDVQAHVWGPLGLGRASRCSTVGGIGVIAPHILPAGRRLHGWLDEVGIRLHGPGDQDIVGVRPHNSSDGRRAIHWRATARAGALMVRLRESGGYGHAAVVIDEGLWTPTTMALAVTTAASLAAGAAAAGIPLAVHADGRRWKIPEDPAPALISALATLWPGRGGVDPLRPPAPPDGDALAVLRLRAADEGVAVVGPAASGPVLLTDIDAVRAWLAG